VIDVLSQVLLRFELGESVALCTVVATHGSTPQDAGAVMMVLRDGHTLGTLGGGCVEAEVRVLAQRLMGENQSRLMRFQLNHDFGWDDGLVCGGTMEIAIQVVGSPEAEAIRGAFADLAGNRPGKLPIEIPDEHQKISRFEIEIPPTPLLLIVGAGHVGRALGQLARQLDFRLAVIDDREEFASDSHFPGGRCIVGDIEPELMRFPIDRHTFIVIVTRGHKHDAQALAGVINSPAKYIGLIGSKRKIHTIFNELHEQGVPSEKLTKVHAPIGLEIAAVTPAEIAISIAAELIAVRRGRGDMPATPMKIPPEKLQAWLKRRGK
jgi:xanthine dehydrogenase accessory factor